MGQINRLQYLLGQKWLALTLFKIYFTLYSYTTYTTIFILLASPSVSLQNFKTNVVHSGFSWYFCKQENSFFARVGRVVMVHDLMFGLFVSAWVTQPQLHSMETQEGPSGPVFVSLPPQNVANWPPPWVRDTLSHPPPFRSHLLWKGQEITVWEDMR